MKQEGWESLVKAPLKEQHKVFESGLRRSKFGKEGERGGESGDCYKIFRWL